MFGFLKNLFSDNRKPARREPMDILRKSGTYPKQSRVPTATPPTLRKADSATRRDGSANEEIVVRKPVIADGGPGKNVLQRTRFVREDTGTHETLKIVDDLATNSDDESGIDPYNTGQFDRSKSWDKHFKK
jgi:hypothetical protein